MGPINLSTAYQTEGICAVVLRTVLVTIQLLLFNRQMLHLKAYSPSVGPGGLEPLPLGRDLQSRCRIRTTFSSPIICTPRWI